MAMTDHERALYGKEFYAGRRANTLPAARVVLEYLFSIFPIRRVVDFGCGMATWLSVARDLGAEEVFGFEGTWLDVSLADIPKETIRLVNLEQPVGFQGRCDLAISLEVAEHLSAGRAASFVGELCAASDVVLFSAAIPGQGGMGHINEQFQSYWVELFAERSYGVYDIVRPLTWWNQEIAFWYRQNALVFVRQDSPADKMIRSWVDTTSQQPLVDVVHPELYHRVRLPGVRGSWNHLVRAVKSRTGLTQ